MFEGKELPDAIQFKHTKLNQTILFKNGRSLHLTKVNFGLQHNSHICFSLYSKSDQTHIVWKLCK